MQTRSQDDRSPGALIYIRTSAKYRVYTEDVSPGIQLEACKTLCERHRLRVKKVAENDIFMIVQNDMYLGDCLVVYSISQLSRKQLHIHQLIDIINRKGCRLLSVAEKIDTNEEHFVLGIYAWLAEIEYRKLKTVKSSSCDSCTAVEKDKCRDLKHKSLAFLRIKLKTRKDEFGLLADEINELSKEEIIELLQSSTIHDV